MSGGPLSTCGGLRVVGAGGAKRVREREGRGKGGRDGGRDASRCHSRAVGCPGTDETEKGRCSSSAREDEGKGPF